MAKEHLNVADYTLVDIEAPEIWSWYRRQVARRQPPAVPDGHWRHAAFSNGVVIPRGVRLLYRETPDLRAEFDDPFDAEGPFYAWLAHDHAALLTPPATDAP